MATWYTRANGNTSGPHSDEQVIDLISRHGDYIEIAPPRAKEWQRPSETEFAKHIPTNPVEPSKTVGAHPIKADVAKFPVHWWVLGVPVALAAFFWILKVSVEAELNAPGRTAADMPYQPPTSAPVEPPPEVTLKQELDSTRTLAGALDVLRDHLKDSEGTLDSGAAFLALWSTRHLTWKDIVSLPKTTRALVLKDSDAERGKALCAEGSISQITADHSAGPAQTVHEGGIVTSSMAVVRFLAVGSTGSLVENSYARFCGVVTGRYSFTNAGGGTTHAVQLVGFFDLPENHKN